MGNCRHNGLAFNRGQNCSVPQSPSSTWCTLLEIAVANNQADAVFKEAELLGFQGIEVSDGSTTVDKETRRHLIKQARDTGFYVISEVGKKNPELDHEMSPAERVAEINDDLANGSNYVIIEAREAGKNIGI